jgi:hypothetical protein
VRDGTEEDDDGGGVVRNDDDRNRCDDGVRGDDSVGREGVDMLSYESPRNLYVTGTPIILVLVYSHTS